MAELLSRSSGVEHDWWRAPCLLLPPWPSARLPRPQDPTSDLTRRITPHGPAPPPPRLLGLALPLSRPQHPPPLLWPGRRRRNQALTSWCRRRLSLRRRRQHYLSYHRHHHHHLGHQRHHHIQYHCHCYPVCYHHLGRQYYHLSLHRHHHLHF